MQLNDKAVIGWALKLMATGRGNCRIWRKRTRFFSWVVVSASACGGHCWAPPFFPHLPTPFLYCSSVTSLFLTPGRAWVCNKRTFGTTDHRRALQEQLDLPFGQSAGSLRHNSCSFNLPKVCFTSRPSINATRTPATCPFPPCLLPHR